ncbi:unnamed protein product [Plutella xylostella]|uniref:(diamondback moth) hypothetical protein n=1 Tax=Plutella xylostella TaxID=51655 RepID=A0A8S4DTQ4_PLUXY|nr:unnamed protein product [Plutella xylostella]
MKAILFCFVVVLAAVVPAFGTQCHVNPVPIRKEWITVVRGCRDAMRKQIQTEVGASLQYLAMGAHFSRDGVS